MKEYTVNIGGLEHTVQLNDEDAERYGETAKPVSTKSAEKPSNKARSASNKES